MVVAMTTEQPLERYMARAIELARQAVGAVSPNPWAIAFALLCLGAKEFLYQ